MVVGAGMSGIVLARRLAEEKQQSVLVVERRQHIGGYCYDDRNEEGILIHRYGPHVFRTNSKKIYDYFSRFTSWIDYQHKVLSYVGGRFYPMPINLDTVNLFLHANYTSETVMDYFKRVGIPKDAVDSVQDVVESQVGPLFYEAFFKNYTEKQWGASPKDLPKEIVSRISVRNNRDDRYFTAVYQGIPINGYTEMMKQMLNHPRIHLLLNTDFQQIKDQIDYDRLFYSGSIDEFYQYRFGKLPYRCVSFQFETLDCEYYQPAAVVNYPNDYDYTRITEFKYFTKHRSEHTVIAKEYSSDAGDPSYPIPTEPNLSLYRKYQTISRNQQPTFLGRLGWYRYLSMDQVADRIFNLSL